MERATDEFHLKQLERCCRACGNFLDKDRVTYQVSTPQVSSKLLSCLGIDIEKDEKQVHPSKLCNCCYVKCGKSVKNSEYHCSIQLVAWKEHSLPCPVCNFFSSKQRGGKKRKATMGRGRPSKKPSSLSQTPETDTINIFKDIVPPKLINDMPLIDRFANLSQELICPICKDVLRQPIQGPCQHFFCLSCIEQYFQLASRPAPYAKPPCTRELWNEFHDWF